MKKLYNRKKSYYKNRKNVVSNKKTGDNNYFKRE